MSQPIIAIERASKSYRNGQQFALHDLSLEIEPATFVAVVGASGSGKTTLLKVMNRLAEVDAGTVRVAGRPVNDRPGHELRRSVGYVFQGIGLFPHLSVAENIGITPRLLGWDAAQIDARVEELADLVALPRNLLPRVPAELSGGQQQRVGVARALAAKPAILLMDEPFGALDPITRDALGTEVRKLHDALGLTTVMITHDVLEAVLLADRIVVMRAGRIVADGSPQSLVSGHPDEDVRAMMEMPRRQAERVRAVLERNSHG
jgi:osmoprotectant transport system ATP-binding protein